MSDEDIVVKKQKSEAAPRRRAKKLYIPRRAPSVVIPPREIVYITPDKTTCKDCDCFPKEDPYTKPKKLNPCQNSPLTLYELAVAAVEKLAFPKAFEWSIEDVVDWMENTVGLPRYKECIIDNKINGLRLLMLEDPSKLPQINIRDFQHIQRIVSAIREEFGMDFVRFVRSIGLPPRRPLVHCTWFKSRTGPTWGIRKNWTRSDILRWMKIIQPAPIHLDHWDLVWYQKPDFPNTKFGRVDTTRTKYHIPMYIPAKPEICTEYMVPRKFRIWKDLPESSQLIWMQHYPDSAEADVLKKALQEKLHPTPKPKYKFLIKDSSRLMPKKISLNGLKGKELILARRLKPKDKFLVQF